MHDYTLERAIDARHDDLVQRANAVRLAAEGSQRPARQSAALTRVYLTRGAHRLNPFRVVKEAHSRLSI